MKCKVNINSAFFAALGPLRPVCTCLSWCEALLKGKKNKEASWQFHTCRWQELTWIPKTVPEGDRGKCKDPEGDGWPSSPRFFSPFGRTASGRVWRWADLVGWQTVSFLIIICEHLIYEYKWRRGSVVSRLQHLGQVHCHLSPGRGGLLQGVSSVLDLCDVPEVGGGDPGGERLREQHPLEDVRGQVRKPVRRTVPFCDVL